jgi:hypothetical protein
MAYVTLPGSAPSEGSNRGRRRERFLAEVVADEQAGFADDNYAR